MLEPFGYAAAGFAVAAGAILLLFAARKRAWNRAELRDCWLVVRVRDAESVEQRLAEAYARKNACDCLCGARFAAYCPQRGEALEIARRFCADHGATCFAALPSEDAREERESTIDAGM